MSPKEPFVMQYPVWAIVKRSDFIIDQDGKTARFGPNATCHFVHIEGNKCCPVFTDDDLAERHLRNYILTDFIAFALEGREQFIGYLSLLLNCGIVHIAVDPGDIGGRSWFGEIKSVIDGLRNSQ